MSLVRGLSTFAAMRVIVQWLIRERDLRRAERGRISAER